MKREFKTFALAAWSLIHYFIAFIGILALAKGFGVPVESEPWKLLVLMEMFSMMAIFTWELVRDLD